MRIRWLGWAGVEIESGGERVVVDPLGDPSAVFAWVGERARDKIIERLHECRGELLISSEIGVRAKRCAMALIPT